MTPNPPTRSAFFAAALILIGLAAAFLFLDRAGAQKQEEPQPAQTAVNSNDDNKPGDDLQKRLSPEQYYVTQKNGTEPAFRNAYWDNHRAGLYVDVVSGEPLFSSFDKFDSGTGWPSFTQPLAKEHVVEKTDRTFGMERTEARSRDGKCHLGHLFDDGPAPTHMRYCINSAALRFVPVEKLAEEGYGQYLPRFAQSKQEGE